MSVIVTIATKILMPEDYNKVNATLTNAKPANFIDDFSLIFLSLNSY
jgi:hypothetical protein